MGIVRELHVTHLPDGWHVNAGTDHAGPFLGELDAAACALVIAKRAPPATVVLHVRRTAAPVQDPAPQASAPGPGVASVHQVRAIYVLARDRHGWDDLEVATACRERWEGSIEDLTEHQAEQWIDELRLLPRGGIGGSAPVRKGLGNRSGSPIGRGRR